MLLMLSSLILAQAAEPSGTPVWVILMIVFLVLVLFLWGVTSSSGIRGQQTTVHEEQAEVHAPDSDEAEEPIEDAAADQSTILEAVQEPEPDPVVETETAVPPPPPAPDDLRKIEGIGPKIQSILNEAGILTFQQLAECNVETLTKIVIEDGNIRLANPETWPEQAELAANGNWDALEKLQDELSGGKRV